MDTKIFLVDAQYPYSLEKKFFEVGQLHRPSKLPQIYKIPKFCDFYKTQGVFFGIRPIWPEKFLRALLVIFWSPKHFGSHNTNI